MERLTTTIRVDESVVEHCALHRWEGKMVHELLLLLGEMERWNEGCNAFTRANLQAYIKRNTYRIRLEATSGCREKRTDSLQTCGACTLYRMVEIGE